MLRYITKRNIAALYLILMCVQYSPLEGESISPVKVAAMCLAPIVMICASPRFTRATLLGVLYLLSVVVSGLLNYDTLRTSTILYLLLFVVMFIMYYNLIYCEEALSAEHFTKLLRGLIVAYGITLIVQQGCRLMGVDSLPLINLHEGDSRGVMIGRSLSLEQSYSARVMAALFLSLIRMTEVRLSQRSVTLRELFAESRWSVGLFAWSMVTMGSGTAFVSLAIVATYFIKRQYLISIIPLLIVAAVALPHINYHPLQRALNTLNATLTLNQDAVIAADRSAADRVVPIITTLTEINIESHETWIGHGVEVGKEFGNLGRRRMVGGITNYGLISYALSLLFVFGCMIRRFASIESLLFFVTLGAGLYNVSFYWGVLMLFATTRYFKIQQFQNDTQHD